jgi:NAD(P)-dependent dehydrogenase (short-subunit alcohol dehydrogenase family)
MIDLKDNNIIITGASSGIGRAIAISCSQLGANIIGLGRDTTRLEETKSLLTPGNHRMHSVDLSDHSAIALFIEELTRSAITIDGLIHAAGISGTHPLQVINDEKLSQFIETNISAALKITQAVTKKAIFSKEGGSIIWITSVMAHAGESGKSLYALTKGALTAAAKSLAIELAPRNIRVNCIAPGVVETPMVQNAYYSQDEATLNRIRLLHPLGLGKPEYVAEAAAFLVSPSARWITGTTLVVDGGYLAR